MAFGSLSSKKLKVLIFELDHGGHRYQYVRSVAEAIDQIASEIVLVTGKEGVESEEFSAHLSDISSHLTIIPIVAKRGATGTFRAALSLIRVLREYAPDHVFIPTGNAVLQFYGLLRPFLMLGFSKRFELEVLLMSGGNKGLWWYDTVWDIATKLARVSTLHTLYALQTETYLGKKIKIAKSIRQSPEPIEESTILDKALARSSLGIPADCKIVSMLGGISQRKGGLRLLEAFLAADLCQDKVLVFAGKFESCLRQLMLQRLNDGRCENVILIDEYLDQEKFFALIDASDLVCLPYEHSESSSGIAVRAASRGVPLLTTDTGWCGATIERYHLGVCVDISDLAAFASTLADSIDHVGSFNRSELNRAFCAFHTLPNFRAHWGERLRERVGIVPETLPLRFEDIDAYAEIRQQLDP